MWDLFCRVVDNLGDVGVCWRLAADLGRRGERVRLWIDDASALAWMAPRGAPGVAVRPWSAADMATDPGDVVVEAFGCTLPDAFVARMAERPTPSVWIDLEYLSAEPHAARSHGLASPQAHGPGRGLIKWFFFPGFVAGTGGLLREPGLAVRRDAFDRAAWRTALGLDAEPGERVVSLFCYAQPALPRLLDALAAEPTLLLLAHGAATQQAARCLGTGLRRGALRAAALPLLAQTDFDALLGSCDLNLVRGEDSFVRAQWVGAPFVWQAYPQSDGAHLAKVRAFLDLHLASAPAEVAGPVRALWRAWNDGDAAGGPLVLPPAGPWAAACRRWRDELERADDLSTQLLAFARARR